ncbi:hypothetical protein G4Z05_01540 [Bacillus thermocopriae]|uniref:Uncharacterized protein n=1 Tax=Neobacillus thermocopriae TaxID=1215031 RepID=A0A6B3TP59_9BACI|nr:hypothetical protein [Neobacillus thermocopriae]MED3624348.1 hypothetical protein [Neobacillus thermocopriae]MED3713457.1 hypothetical protein [Neobacillus thermocopriae]NEX77567.1 hypothetical protein [Neobacillus thermocopriae]
MMKRIPILIVLINLLVMTCAIDVTNAEEKKNEFPSLFVHHETRGSTILVECLVTGITFRESGPSKKNHGKIIVWVDGLKKFEATKAAFMIKGLSPGGHKIKLEVVDLHNVPYGLTKEFLVNIPSK